MSAKMDTIVITSVTLLSALLTYVIIKMMINRFQGKDELDSLFVFKKNRDKINNKTSPY